MSIEQRPVAIVTDSGASIPSHIAEQEHIHVLPMWLNFSDGRPSIQDTDTIPIGVFCDIVETTRATTSAINTAQFKTFYQKLGETTDQILSIHMSHALSGTINNASMAAKELMEERPDLHIHTFDTRSVTIQEGMIARYAAYLSQEGKTLEEIEQALAVYQPMIDVYIGLQTTEQLLKAGKTPRLASTLASVLHIKPTIYFKDDEAHIARIDRTASGLEQHLIEFAEKSFNQHPTQQITVGHINNSDAGLRVQDAVRQFSARQPEVFEAGKAFAASVGKGAVAIAIDTR